MAFTNLTSPSCISAHDHNDTRSRRRSPSRSTGAFDAHSPAPMAIPNRTLEKPPPPLPPPRIINDLAAGSDPGWEWGNDPSRGGFGKNTASSTAGSNFPKNWGTSMDEDRPPSRPQYRRRESPRSVAISPAVSEERHPPSRPHHDEGYYSLSGGPNIMNNPLHGERHLHHRDHDRSSQAYDNKLLSKIGKPKTPPRTSTYGSAESSPSSSLSFGRLPQNQLRSLSFPNSAYSDPPIKSEPSSRFGDSPRSRPISPGLLSSAASAKSFMEYRNPSWDHSSRSSTIDSESYSQYPQRFPSSNDVLRQQKSRRSGSGSLLSNFDESAAASPAKSTTSIPARSIKQESYDQSIFSEPDSTFPMEETVRQLHLEDRPPSSNYPDCSYRYSASHHPLHSSRSRLGMKRKQLSPQPEVSHEEAQFRAQLQQTASTANQFQQNAPSHLSAHPTTQFAQHQSSLSSQSSGDFRNGSFASSGGPSVGGSSYTSIDQHSPGGGISPSEHQLQYQQMSQDPQYNTALSMNPSPRNNARAGPYPQSQPSADTKPPPPRKTNEPPSRRNNAPNIHSNAFMCQCCPKKPKKFDTPEELRQHEGEKQYSCNYCSNRFKNKNEAERHQNSLHLRRHSWSCAVIAGNYDQAFFPSTEIPPATSPGQQQQQQRPVVNAAFDICGYCGLEFPNDPQPDWDDRARHLDQQHKFRECNQSKKFFRADHFRQHLKHSHAGSSGKWTNRLETACIRDEPPPIPNDNTTPPQSAPIANMGNMGQPDMVQPNMNQANMAHSPMAQANMGHGDMSQQQVMAQNAMGQANMVQPHIAQMDMSNIDPSIGIQRLGNMANMGNMAPPQRGMAMQGGAQFDQVKEEM